MPATIRLEDGTAIDADVFIAIAGEGVRLERPSGVLFANPFLPVKARDGVFRILRSGSISCLTVRAEFESGAELPIEDLAGGLARSARVAIRLRGGASIDGTVVYLAPEGQQRVQDLLNQPEVLIFVRDQDLVHIVVKAHVLDVRPL